MGTCFEQPLSAAFALDFNVNFKVRFSATMGTDLPLGASAKATVGCEATIMDVLIEPRAWLYGPPLPLWPSFEMSISVLPLKIRFYATYLLKVCPICSLTALTEGIQASIEGCAALFTEMCAVR